MDKRTKEICEDIAIKIIEVVLVLIALAVIGLVGGIEQGLI